jgi:hypothetical protein
LITWTDVLEWQPDWILLLLALYSCTLQTSFLVIYTCIVHFWFCKSYPCTALMQLQIVFSILASKVLYAFYFYFILFYLVTGALWKISPSMHQHNFTLTMCFQGSEKKR